MPSHIPFSLRLRHEIGLLQAVNSILLPSHAYAPPLLPSKHYTRRREDDKSLITRILDDWQHINTVPGIEISRHIAIYLSSMDSYITFHEMRRPGVREL